MTKYMTQGTIQIQVEDGQVKECQGVKLNITAHINPALDYTVKHAEKEYIVFMPEVLAFPEDNETVLQRQAVLLGQALVLEEHALVFRKQQRFSLSKELSEWCRCKCDTKIEIGIDSDDSTKITSLKIPASFKPCP